MFDLPVDLIGTGQRLHVVMRRLTSVQPDRAIMGGRSVLYPVLYRGHQTVGGKTLFGFRLRTEQDIVVNGDFIQSLQFADAQPRTFRAGASTVAEVSIPDGYAQYRGWYENWWVTGGKTYLMLKVRGGAPIWVNSDFVLMMMLPR